MSQEPLVSYPFDSVPNDSVSFGTVPQDAEGFRILPKSTERKESHILTVHEVARMFESAGVARTERSIINWCQPNKLGVPRLDAFFDLNERRYFISPQSVELAIKEEQAKAAKFGSGSEPVGTTLQHSERRAAPPSAYEVVDVEDSKDLRQEIMDLKLTNRGKDYIIEQLRIECERFAVERKEYVEKLMNSSYQIGELESRLLQLVSPNKGVSGDVV